MIFILGNTKQVFIEDSSKRLELNFVMIVSRLSSKSLWKVGYFRSELFDWIGANSILSKIEKNSKVSIVPPGREERIDSSDFLRSY